ncbi:Ig-like domain-containing protein [Actinoplanes sp. N902-109]|uniref:L,D-transpeptidase n=1 Tax=Actinoplanes sp. (strain N902-109) TaxID=649831 RepID=UPI00059F89EB|nr:Ig-like domain-containing protein [Actinoplanes sp. N902-109]
MVQRRTVLLGALGAAAGLATAACSPAGSKATTTPQAVSDDSAIGTWSTPSVVPSAAPVNLTVSPRSGTTKVAPTDTVTVSVAGGTLKSVSVTAGKKKVGGRVQADGVSWKSTGTLSYGKKYTVTASVVDSLGAEVKKTSTFTTLKPDHVAGTTFQANGLTALRTGGTYGMGQPVIVAFSHSISKKSAAEKAITIETSPAVEGKFHWVSDSIVHWRPAKYWKKGTKISVSVDALGVHLGNGVYGGAAEQTHFTIGRQLLAVSDNRTHRTKVYIDGKLVRDMACSNGRGGYSKAADGHQLHFWTNEGPHVVLSKEASHTMSSASYGLTDKNDPNYYDPEVVKLCTRISYSGEFLHAAPWNQALGRANLSHGCINLSTADAQWVYDNFILGDVVDVRNTPKQLAVTNGLGDWTVSYDKYGA